MPRSVTERQSENRWTPEEDEILLSAIERCGPTIVWSQVSGRLPSRSSKSCRKRWIHSLDPTLRKGRWTEEEDALLITAVEVYGTHWFQVAKMLPGRTDDQCAKRWKENLDPSISRKPWTKEDDDLLMETYEKIGKRWKDIASRFVGRPPVHCRNRVQSLVRARRRAAIAARKASQAKLRGEKQPIKRATVGESSPASLGYTGMEKDISDAQEGGSVYSGTSRDSLPPTPTFNTSVLYQDVQQLHHSESVPSHTISEVNGSSSSQPYHPFVSAHPPVLHLPPQSDYSQSPPTSPPSWGTPPHPQFSQPHILGGNSWEGFTSQSPPLQNPGTQFPGWPTPWSHLEQTGSHFLQGDIGVPIPALAVPQQDSTPAYPSRFSLGDHYSQVLSLTNPNYLSNFGPLSSPFRPSDHTPSLASQHALFRWIQQTA